MIPVAVRYGDHVVTPRRTGPRGLPERAGRAVLDAVLVLLLAVPFYYYLRLAVQQGMRFHGDTFRYLWADAPLNINYFFTSSFSVRALYSLAGPASRNIVKLQVLMLGMAQIALYLSLRRGGAVQRVLLASALALLFGSEEAHWWVAHGLSESLHLSLWILFVCALAAYRGPAANAVMVVTGVLFALSRNTAPYLVLGLVLFYALLNGRVLRRSGIAPALIILLIVAVCALSMQRHLNPSVEHPPAYVTQLDNRFFRGEEISLRLHNRYGMPLGPYTASCRGKYTLDHCLDLDRVLMGNSHSREYELTRDDYGFVDWVRARGIEAWQRDLIADPGMYRTFFRNFPAWMVGLFGSDTANAERRELLPESRKETTPLAGAGTGAISALAWAWTQTGITSLWAVLILATVGSLGYWKGWQKRALALPLLLVASGCGGMFLAFAGVAPTEHHFWPGRICLYLGLFFLIWALVEGLLNRRPLGAEGSGQAPPGDAPAGGEVRWWATLPKAAATLAISGLAVMLPYRYSGLLRQAPLPLPDQAQAALYGLGGHHATAAMARRHDGDLIVVGRTLAPDRRRATHVHVVGDGPGYDIFVARLDETLRRPASYAVIGGSDDDHATDVLVGPAGEVYVAGFTRSRDFPGMTPGRLAPGPAMQSDGFVLRLSPDLSRIEAAIRIGGSDHDVVRALARDERGRLYAAGTTASKDFPVTPGAGQAKLARSVRETNPTANEYGTDGFVARIDAGLRRIEAATYFGGWGDEQVYALALDRRGDLLAAGATTSRQFSTAPDRDGAGVSDANAFIVKLDSELTEIRHARIFGGSENDYARGLAVGADGRIYLAGYTHADDFPVTAGAFQTDLPTSSAHGWVAGLDGVNFETVAATYLSGRGADYILDVAVDRNGQVWVTGETKSINDFPGVHPRMSRFFDRGREDIFLARLTPDLGSVSESILAGGGGRDRAAALLAGGDGSIYVAGDTGTPDFPATGQREATVPEEGRHQIAVLKFAPPRPE